MDTSHEFRESEQSRITEHRAFDAKSLLTDGSNMGLFPAFSNKAAQETGAIDFPPLPGLDSTRSLLAMEVGLCMQQVGAMDFLADDPSDPNNARAMSEITSGQNLFMQGLQSLFGDFGLSSAGSPSDSGSSPSGSQGSSDSGHGCHHGDGAAGPTPADGGSGPTPTPGDASSGGTTGGATDRPPQPGTPPAAGGDTTGGSGPIEGGSAATPTDAQSALSGAQYTHLDKSKPEIVPDFGNGKSDTQAIQAAVDQAARQGGGVVHIPGGTYNIDAANAGIVMKSGVTLLMDKDTTLKAIPNADKSGCIIDVRNVNNVNIYGGKLIGDYGPGASHSGETMSGISVLGSSSNIDIQGVESTKNKGDGFDIQGTGDNIHIAHCVADGNKRDGISVEGGTHVVLEYNALINSGTKDSYDQDVPEAQRLPVSGIDIENSGGLSVDGAIVRNNLLAGNGTRGIDENTTNGWGIRVTGNNDRNSQVVDNTIADNVAGGILVYSGSGNVISGNTILSQPHAYEVQSGAQATGSGNTVDGSPI